MRNVPYIRIVSIISVTFILSCTLLFSIHTIANGDDAEQNYQKFLSIYRRDTATTKELKKAVEYLETANDISPDTFKYVFSLGALNNTLRNWQQATEWLEKAKQLATTDEQLQSTQLELGYCQTQLARLKVETWGNPEISISFIMKKGTLEMDRETIKNLPHRLPVSTVESSTTPIEEVLAQSFGQLSFTISVMDPFLIVSLDRQVSPRDHYEKGVKDFHRYFMAQYFDTPPTRRLVIVLSAYPEAVAEATRRLYPQMHIPVDTPFLGYYNPSDKLIMATGGRVGYGTLLHEMIHALIDIDFPEAPAWLNEGLASLYERTQWSGGHLEPLPNWRMDTMVEDKVSSLLELAQNARSLGLHSKEIEEIRLFLLYLDQRGNLDNLYKMVKLQKESFSLQQAVVELGLTEQSWRDFLKTTFLDYHMEIMKDRGALSNPAEVQFLQKALNNVMGTGLAVDGIWGSSTLEVLLEFQSRFGLNPDGILGPKTMTAIKQQNTLVRLNTFD